MPNNTEIQIALGSIRDWIGGNQMLPQGSELFFPLWILLNSLYNAVGHSRKEAERVVEFGNTYERIFPLLDINAIIQLITPECVGNGKLDNPPIVEVKSATIALRNSLNVNLNCSSCRNSKRNACLLTTGNTWTEGNLSALMRILYQVRCNLFHADKLGVQDPFQQQRDQALINASNVILQEILMKIV